MSVSAPATTSTDVAICYNLAHLLSTGCGSGPITCNGLSVVVPVRTSQTRPTTCRGFIQGQRNFAAYTGQPAQDVFAHSAIRFRPAGSPQLDVEDVIAERLAIGAHCAVEFRPSPPAVARSGTLKFQAGHAVRANSRNSAVSPGASVVVSVSFWPWYFWARTSYTCANCENRSPTDRCRYNAGDRESRREPRADLA